MWTFLLRRMLSIPLTLVGVCIITFILLRFSPGDFFQTMEMDPMVSWNDVLAQKEDAGLIIRLTPKKLAKLGEFQAKGARWTVSDDEIRKDGEPLSKTRAAAVLKKFKLDGDQYYAGESCELFRKVGGVEGFYLWVKRAAKLDFGNSFGMRRPVFGLIKERLYNTLVLSIAALVFAWGLAIPLGVFAAVKPNSVGDQVCGVFAYVGLSLPLMFSALLALLLATYSDGLLPIGDMRDLKNYDSFNGWQKFTDLLHHLLLPTIVLGTHTMAGYMRQTRGNMIEALGQDYVRTARAKGLGRRKVLFKHALRNAINPLVTLFGYSLAALLTGSFFVEVVLNWPGMARLVVDAIFAKDEPVVMASVMVGSVMLMLGNVVADLLLALVDPRVRLS